MNGTTESLAPGVGTSMAPRVLVLAGGLSHERDVSLRSGRRVAESLRDSGLQVRVSDVDAGVLPVLARGDVDVVWPLLHGVTGEDGAIGDILDLVSMPYVGSSAQACRMSWDKSVAKGTARAAGLRTPEAVALPHSTFREMGAQAVLAAIEARLGLPLVVKPARGGSALGVSVVRTPEALPRAMVDCFAYGDVALVERFVEGIEVAISVVDVGHGPTALPAVEIVADGGVYDYDARYTAGATEFFCPARLDAATSQAAQQVAVRAHETFGLRHLSRTDLVIDSEGTPWFLEVNVAPGMTETSLLPQSARAGGWATSTLYRLLVEAALETSRTSVASG